MKDSRRLPMQWKNYRYKLTEEGAVITQYLPEEEEISARIPSGD